MCGVGCDGVDILCNERSAFLLRICNMCGVGCGEYLVQLAFTFFF